MPLFEISRKPGLRGIIVGLLFLLAWAAIPQAALADEDDDPSGGVERSLGIDEAWVENALYLFTFADNDFSTGHSVNFQVEEDIAFSKNFGADVGFPALLLTQPLGSGPATWGPLSLAFKYVAYRFGTPKSASSGIFSLQAGAGLATSNLLPGLGSTLQMEGMGAFRADKFFIQGSYGFNAALDASPLSGWFADTALGINLSSEWVLLGESDFNGNTFLNDGSRGTRWTFVPQVGFSAGPWFLELGEEINASLSGTSVLMVERDF